MHGKRQRLLTIPSQIRADPELVRIVQHRADRNFRSFGQEILYLVHRGIQSDEVEFSPLPSGPRPPEPPG